MWRRLKNIAFPAFLFLVAFLQYSNTLNHDFAWDDKLVITANDYTRQGVKALPDIFTKRVSVTNKNVYRPVSQSTFALEYELFGEKPGWFHFFSVLWYGLACIAVYFFFKFVFPRLHPAYLFAAALLFAVHPLHVEVVANIKSRDEVIALLFGLLSVILLVKGIEKNRLGTILLGMLTLSFSLLSKENSITLLPLIPLIIWFRSAETPISKKSILSGVIVLGILGVYFKLIPLVILSFFLFIFAYAKRDWKKLILYSVIFGVLTLIVLDITIVAPEETKDLQLDSTVLNNIFLWTTESEKVIPTSIVNIGRYLWLFVIPHPLIHLYGYDQISLAGWGDLSTWFVLFLLLFAIYYLFKNILSKNLAVFGILFFITTYSIYSNFFVLAPDTMADRYMFIPSLGLSLIAIQCLMYLGKFDWRHFKFPALRNRLVLGLFALAISAFFARGWYANKDWENDFTLIKNRIQYMEDNAAAQATLGIMVQRESMEVQNVQAQRKLRSDAARAFTKAIDIYPDFYLAWTLIGKIFVEEGYYEKAELAFLKAQSISPLSPDAYQCLGALYFIVGDSHRAIDYLEKSILLDPQLKEAYIMLGKAYIQNGSVKNLGSLARSAMKWFPNNPDFEAFQAFYSLKEENFQEAYTFAKASLSKDPNNLLAISVLSSPQLSQISEN